MRPGCPSALAPCPRPYRAAPSKRASRACRRRQASSPARATASASLASSDAAALSRNVSAPPRANAAWKDSAASSTRRSARARRRGASPAPPRRPAPAQPGPGRGWPGPIGSSLRAVARTGSAAGRAAPGCPRDAAAAAGNAAAARRARTAPSHRRGRRCRCLPAPFRRQRSGERGRARARLRSASDPRLPRRSNRYPVHPPGNRPASAPALRAGRAADRPPRSTASGARRWPATGGAAVQDYPAGEWKRSADDAGPGAVPARVPARPGGGRQRRFPPVPLHAGEHARHCQRQQSTVAQACRPTGHGSRCPGVGRVEPGFAHAAPRTGSEGQALARGKQAPVMERDGMSCL